MTSCQAETAEAKKEDRPKSPSLLAKLLAPFKGEKKEKAEKKPKEKAAKKTEKKEEVCSTLQHLLALSDHCTRLPPLRPRRLPRSPPPRPLLRPPRPRRRPLSP